MFTPDSSKPKITPLLFVALLLVAPWASADEDNQKKHQEKISFALTKRTFDARETPPPFLPIRKVMQDEGWTRASISLHSGGYVTVEGPNGATRVINSNGFIYHAKNVPSFVEKEINEGQKVAWTRCSMKDGIMKIDGLFHVAAVTPAEARTGLPGEFLRGLEVPEDYRVSSSEAKRVKRGRCMLQASALAGVAALGIGIYAIAREVGKKKEEMRKKKKKNNERNKTLQLPGRYPPGWALSR